MPTYTYHCDSCGHGFETVQRFADDPLTECPQCGSRIRRVIQPVGVVFKGSGWYITDSRPKSSSDSAESGSASKTKSTSDNGGGSGKSETPPEADKETVKTPAKVAE